jgi:cytochrome c oxidase assembly protein subunit 11
VTDSSKYTPDRLYPDDDDPSDPSGVRTGAGGDERRITVHFEATSSDDLKWKFTPQQRFVRVRPGETALAFYQAHNWGTEDVVGIATYNITPSRVSPYFAKVECFCFEQQKIRAGEQVDLPVFFFVDKDIREDPSAGQVDDMVLSYTFFK